MIIYKENNIAIADCNYIDGIVTIPMADGSIVCIPEDGATISELEIINQIKEDVANRVVEVIESVYVPTIEERLASAEAALTALMGV